MGIDLNKAYYYIICLIAAFVLMWGVIDLASAGASYISVGAPISEQANEEFYQKRVAQDRLFDSLARIAVAGAVFIYCRRKVS